MCPWIYTYVLYVLAVVLQCHGLYVCFLLLTYVPPLSLSQAWRDLSRTGKSRAGDVNMCFLPNLKRTRLQLCNSRHALASVQPNFGY